MKVPPIPTALRGWTTQTQTVRVWPSRTRDRFLMMAINGAPGAFVVIAIDAGTSKVDPSTGPADVTRAIFEDHAHDVLATRKTLSGATALAERYAKKWIAGTQKSAPCPCETIKVTKRKAA